MSIITLIYSVLSFYQSFMCERVSIKYCLNEFANGTTEVTTLEALSTSVTLNSLDYDFDVDQLKPHPVRLEVYYEVLCPDSRYFLLYQLYPAWQKIGDIMDVQLKPFGKATYQKTPRGYSFKCQHGPAECEGNIVHACAIKYVKDSKLIMDYTKCMIKDNYEPKAAGSKCADLLGIEWTNIADCSSGREGQELLAMYGDQTNNLVPTLTFVPTIVMNGSQEGQRNLLKKLIQQICKTYQGPQPQACIEHL